MLPFCCLLKIFVYIYNMNVNKNQKVMNYPTSAKEITNALKLHGLQVTKSHGRNAGSVVTFSSKGIKTKGFHQFKAKYYKGDEFEHNFRLFRVQVQGVEKSVVYDALKDSGFKVLKATYKDLPYEKGSIYEQTSYVDFNDGEEFGFYFYIMGEELK